MGKSVRSLLPLAALCFSIYAANAADNSIDGRLEDGDAIDQPHVMDSYADGWSLPLNAGANLHVEITGMNISPYVAIFDSAGNMVNYSPTSSYEMAFDWTVPESDTYRMVLTEPYEQDTPYHIEVSVYGDAGQSLSVQPLSATSVPKINPPT